MPSIEKYALVPAAVLKLRACSVVTNDPSARSASSAPPRHSRARSRGPKAKHLVYLVHRDGLQVVLVGSIDVRDRFMSDVFNEIVPSN